MVKKFTPFVLDCGNGFVKFCTMIANLVKTDSFAHAIYKLTDSEWQRLKSSIPLDDPDHFVVNGVHYLIGGQALEHGKFDLLYGAERYTKSYFGVFLAIAVTRMFERSVPDVFLVASHAPKDSIYAEDLMKAADGVWNVVWKGQKFQHRVLDVVTYLEPLGGWANITLSKTGQAYANQSVSKGDSLTLDIGSYTTDALPIGFGGAVNYLAADSAVLGGLDAIAKFKKDFRARFAKEMKGFDKIPEVEFAKAIRTGKMDLRGAGIKDCKDLASTVRHSLCHKIQTFYKGFGGAASFNTIILTGGITTLVAGEINDYLEHNNVIFAGELEKLYMANALGGLKWYLLHQAHGTWGV